MSLPGHPLRSLCTLFIAALAGCGGAAAPTQPTASSPGGIVDAFALGGPATLPAVGSRGTAMHRGWLSPLAKKQRLIYVSDFSASTVEIYPQGQSNPSPIGAITDGIDGPLGNFVDAAGTLYVANALNNTVTEYPPGSTSPSVTLSTDIDYPISVAVDGKGTVAVGEFSASQILEFEHGSSSPNLTITSLTQPEGLAFDRGRHLYAAWNQNTGSQLIGQVSKCARVQSFCSNLGITIGESGGLAIDNAGNLILGDQTNAVIGVYPPGATTPSRTIATSGHDPYKIALDRAEKTLYVADISSNAVVEYDYATGAQTGTISNGLTSVWGVSLSPAARNGP